MKTFIKEELRMHVQVAQETEVLIPSIVKVANLIDLALQRGNKILICGNGGSAGDSQHFAAELTGRYKKDRKALSAIALSTDTSALTAISNDYGYEYIFSRQVEALAKSGDIVFGISTSGNSKNIILAMQKAKNMDCTNIALSGGNGGVLRDLADYHLIIPSNDTPRIQEMHIFIIHTLCALLERHY